MQNMIYNDIQQFEDKAKVQMGANSLYGDMDKATFSPFTLPPTPKKIENKSGEIAEKYLEQIKEYS